MDTADEQLNIVDEDDNIIGQEARKVIHEKSMLHREIHVWVYNNEGELLLQRRAPDKDVAPNQLDASAGGHVSVGESYDAAAIKELYEEVGIRATKDELTFIKKNILKGSPYKGGGVNHAMRVVFAYHFKEGIDSIRMEQGTAISLEWWSMETLKQLTDEEKKEFTSFIIRDYPDVYRVINELQKN